MRPHALEVISCVLKWNSRGSQWMEHNSGEVEEQVCFVTSWFSWAVNVSESRKPDRQTNKQGLPGRVCSYGFGKRIWTLTGRHSKITTQQVNCMQYFYTGTDKIGNDGDIPVQAWNFVILRARPLGLWCYHLHCHISLWTNL